MSVARLKSWNSGDQLTASDLNAEFDNILNNEQSVGSPRTAAFDLDGQRLILDADADTSITADSDDIIHFELAGADLFIMDGDAGTAVNGLTWTAAAAANPATVTIGAQGASDNIHVNITAKGTGVPKASGDAILTGGRHSVMIPAPAMRALTTNGAQSAQVEISAGQPEPETFDFDGGATEEAVQFFWPMPKSWDGGTISYKVHYMVSAAVSTSVTFALAARAFANDDSLNQAYGTAQAITDVYTGTSNDLAITGEPSTAVTVAGSPAGGQLVYFKLFRDTNASENGATADDTSQDARVLAVEIYYEVDTRNDD